MPLRRLLTALLFCLPLVAAAQAPAAPDPAYRKALPATENTLRVAPRPFDARYRLEVNGWPSTQVEHRLSRDGGSWQSRMSAAIAVARGEEQSRFLIKEGGVRSLQYASGYSLLGFGGDYRLAPGDLEGLPDRQAALFELSRRALNGDCTGTCTLRYQDHRGREERMEYRVTGPEAVSLPAGEFDAVAVEVTELGKPERRLVFHFHPELPGLLLAVDYHRDGERRSRLSLTHLTLGD
ncbi:MAG: hypothetical protein IBX53_03210 [Halomonas sp.]|uniref:hypothetical protein n=1 Tax=Halomonas sp. TaxID=1486246 RepID=UPI0019DC92A9|nr:hypothetical protein [Halomonas sp.]MBE0488065.1 hypothetical protein [Halomonas sp.]